MLAASRNNSGDLFSSVQIPIYEEYLKKTGTYDLTVLLNQLSYSSKSELDLYELKRFSLSDKHPKTLRTHLSRLEDLGLISKRKNTLYGRCIYKANAEIYPNDNTLVALIEGEDLKAFPDYLSAAVINKLRTLAVSGKDTLSFSIDELRRELKADKSINSVRRVIKNLEENDLLERKLVGRVYKYKLNTVKLSNRFDVGVINKETDTLLNIFIKYIGEKQSEQTLTSWKNTIRKMLFDGYDYNYLKHIIAYLHRSSYHAERVKNPSHLRHYFDDLKRDSYFNLSRRKANRYIYKLINDQLHKVVAVPEDSKSTNDENTCISDAECWALANTFVKSYKPALRNWYNKQLAGVAAIDFEDFESESKLLLFKYYKENSGDISKNNPYSWLKYKLYKFMYKNRALYNKNEGGKGKIVDFFNDDLSTIIEHVDFTEKKVEDYNVAPYVKELLSKLDTQTADMLSDYYGMGGRQYTYRDLSKKYKVPVSTAHRVVQDGLEALRSYKPPD